MSSSRWETCVRCDHFGSEPCEWCDKLSDDELRNPFVGEVEKSGACWDRDGTVTTGISNYLELLSRAGHRIPEDAEFESLDVEFDTLAEKRAFMKGLSFESDNNATWICWAGHTDKTAEKDGKYKWSLTVWRR